MLLSVCVLTYDQERFISQCLDSILMQDVDFDYEIVVGDDCSSDGTAAILKEYKKKYPEKFVLVLSSKNEGISKNYQKVLSQSKGEFVALCEGDDYWIASDKLQKQVDFLEKHEEYGFVGAYSQLLFPDGTIKEDPYDYLPRPTVENRWEMYGDVFEFAKSGPVTRTVSICFRRSIIEPYLQYEGLGNDMVLQTVLAKYSWFAKYGQVMTVYRHGGVSTNRESFEKRICYNDWYVQNRLLQKKMFPNDCNWDESELLDRGDYIRLKYAISKLEWRHALEIKNSFRTDFYRNKSYSKYVKGPISCFVLSRVLKHHE